MPTSSQLQAWLAAAQTPTLAQSKQDRLAARTADKTSVIQPAYSVGIVSVGDDADTPTINNQPNSTRIRGIDAMETYHGEEFTAKPGTQRHLDTQRSVVGRFLGKPADQVTNQDIFAYGDKQTAEVDNFLGGSVKGADGNKLPALALVEQTLNSDMSPEQREYLYGRNLGTVKSLAGGYTDDKGVEHPADERMWGSNHQYSRSDPYNYNVLNQEALSADTVDPMAAFNTKYGKYIGGTESAGDYDINVKDIAVNYAVEALAFLPEVAAAAAEGGIWIGNQINGEDAAYDLKFEALEAVRDSAKYVKEALGVDRGSFDKATQDFGDDLYKVYSDDKLSNAEKLGKFSVALYDNADLVPQLTVDSYQFVKQMMTSLASGKGASKISGMYNKLQTTTDRVNKAAKAGKVGMGTQLKVNAANALARGTGVPKVLVDTADALEEVKKNGDDVTLLRAIQTGGIKYAENKLDYFIDKATLGMSKQGKDVYNAIGKAIKKLPPKAVGTAEEEAKKGIMRSIAETLGHTAKEVASIGTKASAGLAVEGTTEVIQEVLSMYNERFDTDLYKDKEFLGMLDEESIKQLVSAFGLGVLGATGNTSVGIATTALSKSELVNSATDKAKTKLDEVVAKHNAAKALEEDNPDIPAEELKTASAQVVDAPAIDVEDDYDKEGNAIVPAEVNQQAYGAAVASWIDKQDKVVNADKMDENGIGTDYNALPEDIKTELENISIAFDDNTAGIVPFVTDVAGQVAAAEVKDEAAGIKKDYFSGENGINGAMQEGIQEMVRLRDIMAEKGGTAVPGKLAAMDDIIARMMPLMSAGSSKDLAAIALDEKLSVANRVSRVLGSSQASLDTVNTLLNNPEITAAQKELLEFKAKVIESGVGRTKMDKGGTRPGAMQWASMLANDPENKSFKARLNAFVDGQRSKTNGTVDAIEAWDKQYKMPWTAGNELKQGAINAYGVRGITSDDLSNVNVRATYRAQAMGPDGKAAPRKLPSGTVTIGGKQYDDVAQLAQLAHNVAAEQIQLDELQVLAGGRPSAAQKGTKEAPKKDPEVSTPAEGTKTPGVADGPPTGREISENRKYAIAGDIARGDGVANKDMDFYEGYKEDIDAQAEGIKQGNAKAASKGSKPVSSEDAIFTVDKNTESEYNDGTKEAILLLIKSNHGIRRLLLENGIDIKDC